MNCGNTIKKPAYGKRFGRRRSVFTGLCGGMAGVIFE